MHICCMYIKVCQSWFWAFRQLLAFRRGLGLGILEAGSPVGSCVLYNILIPSMWWFLLVFHGQQQFVSDTQRRWLCCCFLATTVSISGTWRLLRANLGKYLTLTAEKAVLLKMCVLGAKRTTAWKCPWGFAREAAAAPCQDSPKKEGWLFSIPRHTQTWAPWARSVSG